MPKLGGGPRGYVAAAFLAPAVSPEGADTSEADPGTFCSSREGDMTFIRVGKERYEMPDAVPFGC